MQAIKSSFVYNFLLIITFKQDIPAADRVRLHRGLIKSALIANLSERAKSTGSATYSSYILNMALILNLGTRRDHLCDPHESFITLIMYHS